jgi:hypothetical protein
MRVMLAMLCLSIAIDWFTGAKLSLGGVLNVGYFHQKVNSPLQLGVEFESSLAVKETSATFSYQYDLAKANTTFRGKHKRQANYIIESNDHRIEAIRHVSIDCKTS